VNARVCLNKQPNSLLVITFLILNSRVFVGDEKRARGTFNSTMMKTSFAELPPRLLLHQTMCKLFLRSLFSPEEQRDRVGRRAQWMDGYRWVPKNASQSEIHIYSLHLQSGKHNFIINAALRHN
jgi:hypothetical protein